MNRYVVVLELIALTLVCSASARVDLYPCLDPFSYKVVDSIAVDCNNGSFMVYDLVKGDREIRPGLDCPFEHGRSYNDIKEHMVQLHLNITVMKRKTFVVWQDVSMECDRLYVNDALYDDDDDDSGYGRDLDRLTTKRYNEIASSTTTEKPKTSTSHETSTLREDPVTPTLRARPMTPRFRPSVVTTDISRNRNSKTYVVLSFVSNIKELEAECITRGDDCTFVHVDPRQHLILSITGIFLTLNAIVCSSVVAFIYTYQRYKHYDGVSTRGPSVPVN